MDSTRVCIYITVMMTFCGYVSSYIISETSDTKNLFQDQTNDEIEQKIYFLTKLLQEINSLGDTSQSTKDSMSSTSSKNTAIHKHSLTSTGDLPEAFNAETAEVNAPVNSNERATSDDYTDTHDSTVHGIDTLLPKNEHTLEDLESLFREDNTYIKDEFKAIEDIVRPFDEKKQQNSINIEKKDYAILPPASEWCRLMGFRRCRGNQS